MYQHKSALLKALMIPFFLYLLIDISNYYMDPTPMASFVVAIASIFFHTLFAITTHRIILLGPSSVPKWGILSWKKRETLFVLHMLGLGLLLILLMALSFIPMIGVVLFYGSMAWLLGRLSMVFPAIAIDQAFSFKHSWVLTKNYQTLMMLVVLFYPLLLFPVSLLFYMIPHAVFIISIISTISTVLAVAALSITFKEVCLEELNG